MTSASMSCARGLLVVPGDGRFARVGVVVGGAHGGGDLGRAATSRATCRIAVISWMTVSWVATASSSTAESSARRTLPVRIPGLGHHGAYRGEDPLRIRRVGQEMAEVGQKRRVEPGVVQP